MTVVKAASRVGGALVRSHSADDWQQVESSILHLVGFLRELTKPGVMQALQAIIDGFGSPQATIDVNKSFFTIARGLNSPDARRGIAIMVEFLKVVAANAVRASSLQTDLVSTSTR